MAIWKVQEYDVKHIWDSEQIMHMWVKHQDKAWILSLVYGSNEDSVRNVGPNSRILTLLTSPEWWWGISTLLSTARIRRVVRITATIVLSRLSRALFTGSLLLISVLRGPSSRGATIRGGKSHPGPSRPMK